MEPKEHNIPGPRENDQDVPVQVEDRRHWARAAADPAAAAGDEAEGAAAGPEAPRYPSFVAELEARMRASQERVDQTLAAHRRMQAEFDEYRLRLNRDVDARVQQAKAGFFRRLLEIADHMDLALQAAAGEGSGGAESSLAQGLRLIQVRLATALKEEGAERLNLIGDPFDPELAEAVAVVPVDDPALHDCVVAELRAGYRLGDVILRPAQVQVGRHTGVAASPGAAPTETAGD